MKILLITISFLLFALLSSAQITFQKTFGASAYDHGFSVHQTTDSGYVVAGSISSSGVGDEDIFLLKTNVNGDTIWSNFYGGLIQELARDVQQTSDGGYIITGPTNSFGTGNADIILIKTDASGISLWTKTYGGIEFENGYSLHQTTDSGFIITGSTTSFGAGNSDVYLIKTDVAGNLLWTKAYGGNGNDMGISVQQTTDSGFIIAGVSESFGAINYDVYLIKTDSNGDTLWTKTYGGANYDEGTSIRQTLDGSYIIAGATQSFGNGGSDVFLIRSDMNGNILWTKTFGGTSTDYGTSVQQTSDGGFVITGTTNLGPGGNVYLIKTDINGDTLWTKTFGGSGTEFGRSIQQTLDGGYIISGTKVGNGTSESYLIKTDSSGNSGCTQGSAASAVTTPTIQVTSRATIVTSASTSVVSVTTIPGSGGFISTICSSVNIHEIPSVDFILISPNPTFGNFNISLERNINKGYINIFNILGENVYFENINNELNKTINLDYIPAGIYFVKVFDGEKSYCTKLIVE